MIVAGNPKISVECQEESVGYFFTKAALDNRFHVYAGALKAYWPRETPKCIGPRSSSAQRSRPQNRRRNRLPNSFHPCPEGYSPSSGSDKFMAKPPISWSSPGAQGGLYFFRQALVWRSRSRSFLMYFVGINDPILVGASEKPCYKEGLDRMGLVLDG